MERRTAHTTTHTFGRNVSPAEGVACLGRSYAYKGIAYPPPFRQNADFKHFTSTYTYKTDTFF